MASSAEEVRDERACGDGEGTRRAHDERQADALWRHAGAGGPGGAGVRPQGPLSW